MVLNGPKEAQEIIYLKHKAARLEPPLEPGLLLPELAGSLVSVVACSSTVTSHLFKGWALVKL